MPDVAIDDDVDEFHIGDPIEDDDETDAPASRPRAKAPSSFRPGHRQVTAKSAPIVPGLSPWEKRPREGFTQSMEERVPEMRQSKQATYVKGLPADDASPRRRL